MTHARLCVQCGNELPQSKNLVTKFCDWKCKNTWHKANYKGPVSEHQCRICGVMFPIGKGQNNKWTCSDACRRARVAKSVREFHLRRPQMEAIYRARTKEKQLPDSNMIRFYRNYPEAPRKCESCAEDRVLEIAHRPGHERFGQGRTIANQKWPDKVWVLCPTCHRLLDRMGYTPHELGLK